MSKIPWINPRGKTYCPIIVVVLKQELFGFALSAKRATDPFLNGAGDHGAPQLLLCYFLVSTAMTQSFHLPPQRGHFASLASHYEEANAMPFCSE